jgi:hypothetical protein
MIENITKIDVARRQLREAIWLLFYERDAIAIHTLAAASYQVLDDLCKRRGIASIRRSQFIRQDKQKYWLDSLNKAQNFFKHADKDPEGIHEFCPALTHFFLLDSIFLYVQLTKSAFPEIVIFFMWFILKYPLSLTSGETLKEFIFTHLGNYFDPGDLDPDDLEAIRVVLSALPDSLDSLSMQSFTQLILTLIP